MVVLWPNCVHAVCPRQVDCDPPGCEDEVNDSDDDVDGACCSPCALPCALPGCCDGRNGRESEFVRISGRFAAALFELRANAEACAALEKVLAGKKKAGISTDRSNPKARHLAARRAQP